MVPASLMLRRLGSYPRQNGLALALREVGRIERTLFTLDWLEDPTLRRQATAELNKGESRNALSRAVRFHRLGRVRDRTRETQQHRASGLNLSVAAIILWNTVYLGRAIETLRGRGEVISTKTSSSSGCGAAPNSSASTSTPSRPDRSYGPGSPGGSATTTPPGLTRPLPGPPPTRPMGKSRRRPIRASPRIAPTPSTNWRRDLNLNRP